MAKRSRGRRAVAEQLGLIDEEISSRAGQGRAGGGAKGAPRGGTRGAGPSRNAGRGGALPSDGAIVATMIKRIFGWVFRLIAGFVIASIALVIIYRFIDPPLTPLMLIRPVEGLAGGRFVGIDMEWIDIDDVNPALLRSVIAAEDGKFFSHAGVDIKALQRARAYNERMKGKRVHGGSTITMQCARNVFLWQGRNYIRKGLEIYFSYLMEFFWSKKRILEVYVNVIEWGDGVYGVEAASRKYFGVSASRLDSRQAALLASVLPNPRRWSPAAPTKYISGRASTIRKRASGVGLGPLGFDAFALGGLCARFLTSSRPI